MRLIDNLALLSMRSPARLLFEKLPTTLVHIAPERAEEFDRLYPNFTIEYVDSDAWVLHFNAAEQRIRISSFVAEFVWATGYAHLVYYLDVFQGKSFQTRHDISLQNTPRLRSAMALLKWAVEKLINKTGPAWPACLPHPRFRPGFASDEDLADEFAVGSVACLIHHEFGHLALSHAGASTIDIERDADAHAWDWVLGGGIDIESNKGKKRLLQFAHAHCADLIRDIHQGTMTLVSHPRSIDRIFNLFSRWNVPHNHLAVAFTYAVLHLHLENSSNRQAPQSAAYRSDIEALDAILNHISTFPTIG